MNEKFCSTSHGSFYFQKAHDTFSHKRVYEELRKGFDEHPARIMSETLIELADQQDDKITRHIDRILEYMDIRFKVIDQRFEVIDQRFEAIDTRMEQMVSKKEFHDCIEKLEFRIISLLHKELYTLTWRMITAVVAWSGLMLGTVYYLVQTKN